MDTPTRGITILISDCPKSEDDGDGGGLIHLFDDGSRVLFPAHCVVIDHSSWSFTADICLVMDS